MGLFMFNRTLQEYIMINNHTSRLHWSLHLLGIIWTGMASTCQKPKTEGSLVDLPNSERKKVEANYSVSFVTGRGKLTEQVGNVHHYALSLGTEVKVKAQTSPDASDVQIQWEVSDMQNGEALQPVLSPSEWSCISSHDSSLKVQGKATTTQAESCIISNQDVVYKFTWVKEQPTEEEKIKGIQEALRAKKLCFSLEDASTPEISDKHTSFKLDFVVKNDSGETLCLDVLGRALRIKLQAVGSPQSNVGNTDFTCAVSKPQNFLLDGSFSPTGLEAQKSCSGSIRISVDTGIQNLNQCDDWGFYWLVASQSASSMELLPEDDQYQQDSLRDLSHRCGSVDFAKESLGQALKKKEAGY